MTDQWMHHPTLTGQNVRLEPLTLAHAPGLHEAGKDPAVWPWLGPHQPATVEETALMIQGFLDDSARIPFAQIDLGAGEVAGTTTYYEIDPVHRGLYIGHTWIGTRWQRTALNTEAKLLLMGHAFDTLGANRVGWHADINNKQSQRAIERLGARREGVLRSHRIRKDGSLRDTVSYSVVAAEWPAVRARLLARLA